MYKYILKRKEGEDQWKINPNSVKNATEASIEIASKIQEEMELGKSIFIIVFAVPNTEVIILKNTLEKWLNDSNNLEKIELIFNIETCDCFDLIVKKTIKSQSISLAKCIIKNIETNELEEVIDGIKDMLKEDLKENFIFILPGNFQKKNDDGQIAFENFIQLWARILGNNSIMFQCINIGQTIEQIKSYNLSLQSLLDERDNLYEATPYGTDIITEIIETRNIQMIEEYLTEDKDMAIGNSVDKNNNEYTER